ncbi:hypothetical protein [Rhizobium sp. L51/94]|uniref:hypothetical protein n=1 Tax=Rhizobium sp. L51/94 TaxID=2819999 RepID=UPI001C5B1656|nr:hypothetical protein [Rhizobium sp. L51/94]QXZ79643.1 hypothetical protein J5274_06585 [Rhizobium sp. L51/94]
MTQQEEGSETRWYPEAWLDGDVGPASVPDPCDLVHQVNGAWVLADDLEDGEEAFCRMEIEPGQVVQFLCTRHYGTYILTVGVDGSFSLDRPHPADATHFAHTEASSESMSYSLQELVNSGHPEDVMAERPLDKGENEIEIWFWSEAVPFRFEVEDGAPKFTRCAGVN